MSQDVRHSLPYRPEGWGTLVADPPWDYRAGRGASSRGRIEYPTLATEELLGLPIAPLLADRALCLLWTTSSFLAEGLECLSAWGFEYRSQIAWIKGRADGDRLVLQIGLGSYVRLAHELVLIGSRGGYVPEAKDVPSVIVAPRAKHSVKPSALLDYAERLGPPGLPRLEPFARRARPGWTAWGIDAPGGGR